MNVDLDTKLPLLCVPIHNNVGPGRRECVGVIYLVLSTPPSFHTKKMLDTILRQVPTILHGAEAINSLNGLSIDAKVEEMNAAARAIQSRVRGMLIRKKRREKRLGKVLIDGINNEKEETKIPGTTVFTDEGKSEALTKSESKAEEEVEVTQQEQ